MMFIHYLPKTSILYSYLYSLWSLRLIITSPFSLLWTEMFDMSTAAF